MKQIIAVVAILAFLPSVGFADECGCDAILLRGVFNNTSIKSNEEYKSAATDYLCSMDAGTMSGNNKTSLGIITSVRNPVFLDRHSGFDWTVIPVLSGQWFSVFLPAVVLV